MPITGAYSAACDICGITFEPTRYQRQNKSNRCTCLAPECRSKIASLSRRDYEESRFVEKAEAALPTSRTPLHIVGNPSQVPTNCNTWQPDLAGTKRFLVIGDIHAPFQHEAALDRALAHDADICVVNGDLSDSYNFSTFAKKQDVGWTEEWDAIKSVADRLKKYPLVYLISGNHDARMGKRLADAISPQWAAWIRERVGTLDPLAVLEKEYPNIHMARRTVEDYEVRWFDQIGDVIFSHAEEYSGGETNAVVRKVDTYFHNHAVMHGLDPYRLIIQGHTHDLSWNLIGGSRLIVQSGCLTTVHDYQINGRRLANRPQQLGFVTFIMTDGKVDLETVHPHWLAP